MSGWAGLKGKPPTRPHHPSRLRNEVLVGSAKDERADNGGRVEVPGSDTVIPQTQLDNLEDDVDDINDELRPHQGKSDHPMSPNSRALLSRTRISRTREAPANSLNVQFLSRPSGNGASPEPFFYFTPARKIPSTLAHKDEAAPVQETHIEVATASDLIAVVPTNGKCLHNSVRAHPASPGCADDVSEEKHQVLPGAYHVESSLQEHQEPPTPNPPELEFANDILNITSYPVAEDLQTAAGDGRTQVPRMRPIKAPRPYPQPRFPPAPKGPPGRKGRKGRKLKPEHHREAPWPPKAKYEEDGKALAGQQGNEQSDYAALPTTPAELARPEQVESGHVNDLARSQLLESGHVDDTAHDNQEQSDNRELAAPEQEVVPTAAPSHSPIKTVVPDVHGLEDGAVADEPQVDHPQHSSLAPQTVSQTHRREEQLPRQGGSSGGFLREEPDEVLHQTSSRGVGRIDKPRKKPRAGGSPRLPTPKPGFASIPKLSTENEAFLRMIALTLDASETKARNIVDASTKANETAIASLQETIGYQDNVIENHKAENGRLQDDVRRLQEKSARLEKYVKGMEHDYSRLNGQVKAHQKSCNHALQEKIAEIEAEKSSLVQEFMATLDTLDRSRRNMKSVVDDCYAHLVISESKKADLTEQLCRQNILYEEEKKRRSDLEQQIQPALQSLQEYVIDSRNALADKLRTIKGSLDNITADEERDTHLKQFVDALHSLQATPFLTAEDLQKAERMLRFVHESIGTKLNEVATFVQEDRFPVEGLQHYIRDQLEHLRSEVLKYDEAVAECRKVQVANQLLTQQVDAQKEHCTQLEESICGYRQNECDLKSRYAQLEQELVDLRETTHNHDSDLSELQQELANMQDQMKKVEEDRQTKVTELDHARQRLQDQGDEVARSKQLAAEQKAVIGEKIEQIEQIQQSQARQDQKRKALDASADIHRIEETYRNALKEKELSLGNEIHRLQAERNEYQESTLSLTREVELVRDKLQRAQEDIYDLTSEGKKLREAKTEAEEKLKKLQQAADEGSSSAFEAASLKQQPAQKTMDFQVEERELEDLRKSYTSLESRITIYQQEKDRLESELTEKLSTIGTLQKDLNVRLETNEKDAATILELQNQAESLQKENRDLGLSLERAQITESKFNDAQARFSVEKRGLQTEITELRSLLEAKEQERHRQGALHQFASQVDVPSTAASTPLTTIASVHAGRPRKRVNRQNTSVLSIVGQSRTRLNPKPGGPSLSQAPHDEHGVTSGDDDAFDLDHLEGLGTRERLDENGVFVIDPATDAKPGRRTGSAQAFNDFGVTLAGGVQTAKDGTSSSLSDAPSSELIDMEEFENSVAPAGVSPFQERDLVEELPARHGSIETPSRTPNASGQDPRMHWSQDRPKSQANTALRLMAPGPFLEPSASCRTDASPSVHHRSKAPKYGDTVVISDASSPDYVQRQPSTHKTYGHHVGALGTATTRQRSSTPQIRSQEPGRKRKSSESHSDDRVSSKRFRSSSQSLPTSVVRKASQRGAPVTSGVVTRRRGQNSSQGMIRSSQTQIAPPSRSAQPGPTHRAPLSPKRALGGRKRGSDIARFDQELESAEHRGRRGMR